MGGCCCCSSNRVEWNNSPRLYHYPVVSEDRQPLSAHSGVASVVPTGLLVDTNLDTSIPDTYRHPPAPLPYEAIVGDPQTQTPPVQTNCSDPIEDIKISNHGENLAKETMESDCKDQIDIKLVATEEDDGEVKKSNAPFVAPEECPTCLEEYDEENPKIVTKCEHHFHLSCILEWMERSNTCPVCDQVTPNFNFNNFHMVFKNVLIRRNSFKKNCC
ncbi:probable E3 ubiquitin-protein ligase RHB1A isoform X1 [Lactuca sativa]|uniref:probable E3 ubiquitin-protein ligase RHB1A isoform X1 n=1 Tax=Lactuca sativa TaxID=4236 RepID=UPI0022AF5417|nr:probable E3 ubiquitin-protein ligase RHB1A isoform X1 [Lactuca sativa]XP_052625118.1 probable E3 ubiquitin-protein ligase RHB1A isoform X1 [Lactuca sativa]XP_052625119.1 probable E3 ubiquitin-protein ligase RHB1A isoform X1 [Lactuca sativa]XP_052625120.1 probable E3 ubiquitin-protein ligase RHB1A isoform X1 [Lactuca sativa]